MGWSRPAPETYAVSQERPYYDMLKDYLIQEKKLNVNDIKWFLKSNFHHDQDAFDPYKLTSEEAWDVYIEWCKTKSTKNLYFNEVRKSFAFIENFCINKSIDLKKYKLSYAAKHIREQKIDGAVAVHLKLIDRKKLSKVDKLLLKNYLSQYNILESRLSNPELSKLLTDLTQDMTKLLQEYHKDTENEKSRSDQK